MRHHHRQLVPFKTFTMGATLLVAVLLTAGACGDQNDGPGKTSSPGASGETSATGGSVAAAPTGGVNATSPGGTAGAAADLLGGRANQILAGTGGMSSSGASGRATAGQAGHGTSGQTSAAAGAGGAGGAAAGAGGFAGSISTPPAGRAGALAGGGAAGVAGSTGAAGTAGTSARVWSGGAGPGCPTNAPCAGYTLFGVPPNGRNIPSTLIDMDGQVVHTWATQGFPAKMLPGGRLLGCSGVFPTAYDCLEIRQESWSGEIEWSFSAWTVSELGDPAARQHHDLQRQGNPVGYYAPRLLPLTHRGTTLVLAHDYREVPEVHQGVLMDDVIYEVDWSGTPTGFEWHGVDHIDEFGFDAEAREDILTRDYGGSSLDWLHGNSMSRVGGNPWFESGHEEFDPKNIIYSSRDANFVIIIDHETGDVVWRLGPDFAGRPEEVLGQFVGQHNPHLIPQGLPGAGNMLVFDNGGDSGYGVTTEPDPPFKYSRSYSRVLEFNPVTFEIVWEYGAPSGDDYFFSYYVSNAQRLPNGNTLISIGNDRRIIEVTPEREKVWEYEFEPDLANNEPDWIYRAYRVPPEWLPRGENERFGRYPTWASQLGD